MGFTFINKLPTPAEIREQYPLPLELAAIKETRDEEIAQVFKGESDKLILIIGPCSADNEDSVCDYANRLAKVQEKVADKLILIPRVYTNKPRTTGDGYKGMLHQPDPERLLQRLNLSPGHFRLYDSGRMPGRKRYGRPRLQYPR